MKAIYLGNDFGLERKEYEIQIKDGDGLGVKEVEGIDFWIGYLNEDDMRRDWMEVCN